MKSLPGLVAMTLLAIAATGGTALAELARIEGTATYRERVALHPAAVLEVELLDASRADAPADRLSAIRIKPAGQPPIPFTLYYDPSLIEHNRRYVVTARLLLDGKTLFRTDTTHLVLTNGAGRRVEAEMVMTAQAPPSEPAPALIGPTWVAEDIGGHGVVDMTQSRLTLVSDGMAHGSGGCNSFSGKYSLEAGALRFGPIASTRMACPEAISDQESRFFAALGRVAGYRIEKDLLFLADAQGQTLMRFWAKAR